MVCLNHTAAASSEPRCLSLSQTFMLAPRLPEGWFQITVDGLETSHWFGAKTHYEARTFQCSGQFGICPLFL